MKPKESKATDKKANPKASKIQDLPAKKLSKRTETAVKGGTGGTRNIVDVIFAKTNRNTDFTEKF